MGVCPICQKDNGTILLDKRLRDRFEMRTIDPKNPCEKCRKKYLAKGTMIFSPTSGDLLVIKDSAFKRVFNVSLPKGKVIFCDQDVIDKLKQ